MTDIDYISAITYFDVNTLFNTLRVSLYQSIFRMLYIYPFFTIVEATQKGKGCKPSNQLVLEARFIYSMNNNTTFALQHV